MPWMDRVLEIFLRQASLGRGQHLAGFPGGGVWTKATPRGGASKDGCQG